MKQIPEYNNRYSITTDGKIYSHLSNRFLVQRLDKDGYPRATLMKSEGEQVTRHVHRLVALTYLNNPDNMPHVNHIDGNKENNHFSNLEWCTCQYNRLHAVDNGLVQNVKKHSDELAHKVISYIMDGWRRKDVATSLGLTISEVGVICKSRQYEGIREEYDWENRPSKQRTLSTEKVVEVCMMLEQGCSYQDISSKTGVKRQVLRDIKSRHSYSSLSKSFVF